jgi:predicted AlkP superfamily pyrophosphatase or phosphodiesterase
MSAVYGKEQFDIRSSNASWSTILLPCIPLWLGINVKMTYLLVATRDLSISTIFKIKGFGVSTRNCQQTIKKIWTWIYFQKKKWNEFQNKKCCICFCIYDWTSRWYSPRIDMLSENSNLYHHPLNHQYKLQSIPKLLI